MINRGDPVFTMQINEMRQDIAGGGWQKRGGRIDIDPRGEGCAGGGALGERLKDLGLARQAVPDQPIEPLGRGVDRGTMAGMEDAPIALLQAAAGGHEICEIAFRRRDKRAGPAHHQVTAEHGIAERKAQVVAEMTRGVERREAPVRPVHHIPIGQGFVRGKLCIDAFTAADKPTFRQALHDGASPAHGIRKGMDRRLCCSAQGPGQRRMIDMRMRDEDRGYPCRANGLQKGGEMGRIIRAGVDHGKITLPHKIAVGPPKRHR